MKTKTLTAHIRASMTSSLHIFIITQVGCVSEFRNCMQSWAWVSVIFLYLFVISIVYLSYRSHHRHHHGMRANWIQEVSQMKIKPSFILGCMDIIIFLDVAISSYRFSAQCLGGRNSRCWRRGAQRYEKKKKIQK